MITDAIAPPRTLQAIAVSARPRHERARAALDLVLADLAEHGIRPSSLNVMAHAVEHGAGERLAADAAELFVQEDSAS
jgi:hypothetical protein